MREKIGPLTSAESDQSYTPISAIAFPVEVEAVDAGEHSAHSPEASRKSFCLTRHPLSSESLQQPLRGALPVGEAVADRSHASPDGRSQDLDVFDELIY